MTRAQVADAVAVTAEALSSALPAHWGQVADVVAVIADTYARDFETQQMTGARA